MKMKYDESDNAFIRASRLLTDKVTDLLGEWAAPGPSPHSPSRRWEGVPGPHPTRGSAAPGGLFSKTEMSEVLTEILRVDPAFDKDRFLQQCENDIIPNVLEVGVRLAGPRPCGEFWQGRLAVDRASERRGGSSVDRGLSTPHAQPLLVEQLEKARLLWSPAAPAGPWAGALTILASPTGCVCPRD